MDPFGFKLRRATSEDLPALSQLWSSARLDAKDLEKRFTEFQLVQNEQGALVGAMGLRTVAKDGCLHSETIPDFSQADLIRPLLWERLKTVAQNYGLIRLWTGETAPFWKQQGFVIPEKAILEKAAADLTMGMGKNLLTLKLKEEIEVSLSLDKEFAMFREVEKERTERIFAQAKALNMLAILIAIGVFFLVILGSIYLLKNRQLLGR